MFCHDPNHQVRTVLTILGSDGYLQRVLKCKSRIAVSPVATLTPPSWTYISDAVWISLQSNQLLWINDRHFGDDPAPEICVWKVADAKGKPVRWVLCRNWQTLGYIFSGDSVEINLPRDITWSTCPFINWSLVSKKVQRCHDWDIVVLSGLE